MMGAGQPRARFIVVRAAADCLLTHAIPSHTCPSPAYPQLFDLAGITCGHFGIPFATFFGATLLGEWMVRNGCVIAEKGMTGPRIPRTAASPPHSTHTISLPCSLTAASR
jgi:hypothetical protein